MKLVDIGIDTLQVLMDSKILMDCTNGKSLIGNMFISTRLKKKLNVKLEFN